MPEGLEVELYRRAVQPVVGRRIDAVDVDARVGDPVALASVVGATIEAPRRRGKQLAVPTTAGPVIGIHFGMTGRIVVGEHAPIERLEYGASRDDPAWDRFRLRLDDGAVVRVNDPRRWSKVVIDPDLAELGPDLLSITVDELGAALGRRRTTLKAVLLDQRAVAGLGNLCVDEVLWQAGLDPRRRAADVSGDDVRSLHDAMATHLPAMLARGGSHTGTISPPVRAALPPCPHDGAPLARSTVAGRTTVHCPEHQR